MEINSELKSVLVLEFADISSFCSGRYIKCGPFNNKEFLYLHSLIYNDNFFNGRYSFGAVADLDKMMFFMIFFQIIGMEMVSIILVQLPLMLKLCIIFIKRIHRYMIIKKIMMLPTLWQILI